MTWPDNYNPLTIIPPLDSIKEVTDRILSVEGRINNSNKFQSLIKLRDVVFTKNAVNPSIGTWILPLSIDISIHLTMMIIILKK